MSVEEIRKRQAAGGRKGAITRARLYSHAQKSKWAKLGGRRTKIRMMGRVFGRLKVVASAGKKRIGTQGADLWKVQCLDCNAVVTLMGNNLRSGQKRTKKCRCSSRR